MHCKGDWDNVEMLMARISRTIKQLENDMKIYSRQKSYSSDNTNFVNNLPAYWGKYVTNVKQNMDISTTPYVQIYTHLKAYEPHAKKTLKKQEQSTSIVDPLAYWFSPKAVPPTNNQLRTSSNSKTHATVHDGLDVTDPFRGRLQIKLMVDGRLKKKEIVDAEAESFLADLECIRTL
ncbi:hypothetical protein Tco_1081248 [Tanacetum coccineum]|uniref:Uncharacterized protein n=1 Tax=Tanacetum coccineum TaxID=301880 RepID=A0ABQ5HX47_9ASTR